MVVVSVLGCGMLGSRISGELAICGHQVRVWDQDPRKLDILPDQLEHDKQVAAQHGLLVNKVLGEVNIFSDISQALKGASIIVEAIIEDEDSKSELMQKVSDIVDDDVILATSTLRLDIAKIFSSVDNKNRCLGVRFLFPVYSISEVEVTPWSAMDKDTMNTVTQWLERMGKTAFLRSGPEPLILSEEARDMRWRARAQMLKSNKGLGGRVVSHIPYLAHRGNFAPPQDDQTRYNKGISIEQECIICMDTERDCLLSPCCHLATCQACGDLLVSRREACPICRTNILEIINFYRS